MFHLLVSYQGWPEGRGSLSTSRVYINRTDSPGNTFLKTDGSLDINKIKEIPALLVSETGGAGPQIAKVAYITDVHQTTRETEIQYTIDNSIPGISNQDLENFCAQLNLGRFGLTHSCWAINKADLFKLLLINARRNSPTPTVFSINVPDRPIDNLVSLMMPFSAEFNSVHTALKQVVSSMELECRRADNFWEHRAVIQDVVSLIVMSQIVICDCSGKNPNVFYEAGIAHALGKEVILIAQSESDIPFDLRHLRYIHYLNNNEGLANLSEKVRARIQTLLRPR